MNSIEKTRIMIVEDSPTQAAQLEHLLVSGGYAVTVATNGKEALALMETAVPDLVLSDIVMPEMDGYELCRTIKGDKRFRSVPVILVTVLSDTLDIIRGLECGADNFLIKPYEEKSLNSRIEAAISTIAQKPPEASQPGVDVTYAGKEYHVTASRLQILDCLLSTYETTVDKNRELLQVTDKLRDLNEHLEDLEAERTIALQKTNSQLLKEIEVRKKTEEDLKRKSRAYQVISECNQFLVRATYEKELLNRICSILTTIGGYRGCWVGYLKKDADKSIELVAQEGFDQSFLATLKVSWGEGFNGKGPTGSAARRRVPVVIQDIPHHPECRDWISEPVSMKYSTVAAFPLSVYGEILGVLTIYSDQPDAFDSDEIRLLSEMASDLSFGIQGIRTRRSRDKAVADLLASEKRYRMLMDQLPDYVLVHRDGILLYANPSAAASLGYEPLAMVGRSLFDFVDPADSDIIRSNSGKRMLGDTVAPYELRLLARDGSSRSVYVNGSIVPYEGSQAVLNVLTDITAIKEAEEVIRQAKDDLEQKVIERTEALTAANQELTVEIAERKELETRISRSLKEKEVLLKEIHHRVKNNIQVIASLLSLQASTVKDPETQEVLREAQNRVKSIALVHEKLYQSKSLDQIAYKEYLEIISSYLLDSYGVSPGKIALKIQAENTVLHLDKAIPCSLMVNELLSNAIKHAFPGDRKGEILIDVHQENGTMSLRFSDNGIGLPDTVTFQRTESLGMRLLAGLTQQLRGKIEIERREGTTFLITFPV